MLLKVAGSAGFGVLDPRDWSTSYSSAAWDIRHSFTTSFNYDLPFGKAAHLGNKPVELLKIVIERLGGMIRTHDISLPRNARQPKRPVM